MSIDLVIHNMQGYDKPFHFESELRAANRLADGVTDGVIVSVGSFRGQFDCALALHAHVPIYCIDPRQGWIGENRQFGDVDRPFWMQNILSLGLAERVRPIELPSLVVAGLWDKPISFLWVDGNHQEVAADLDAWLPHVVPGGIVGVHDNNAPSIIAAVTRRDDMVEFERANISTFYRKEPLYEEFTYDGITHLVRKGPYNHDDKYVWGEILSYDIGTEPIHTCIDVGGMIGSFSDWIKRLYPAAQIVAVEPEPSNWQILNHNLGAAPGVTLLNQRVNYDSAQQVLLVNPINSGCHRIVNREDVTPGQSVVPAPEAITLEKIMKDQGWETLDMLKLDCEGAETDILLNCSADFLRSVKRIVGEFHTNFGSPMEPIQARLEALGFTVTAETNPAAHATFLAINQNWQEPEEEPAIEYGMVIEEPNKPAPKRTPPKGKKR